MLTRVFQSGNSIAVRIPKELAIVEASQDVLIERVGNTLVIRPVPLRLLAGIADIFAEFSGEFMAAGPEFHKETARRDWARPDSAPAESTVGSPVGSPVESPVESNVAEAGSQDGIQAKSPP